MADESKSKGWSIAAPEFVYKKPAGQLGPSQSAPTKPQGKIGSLNSLSGIAPVVTKTSKKEKRQNKPQT